MSGAPDTPDSDIALVQRVQKGEARACDMGIDLRGGDVGMAEHALHAAQIGAVFEQMGGESMA